MSGRITDVDPSTGVIKVGSANVDYSPLLSDKNVAFMKGQILRVVGTQPVRGGVILATEIWAE